MHTRLGRSGVLLAAALIAALTTLPLATAQADDAGRRAELDKLYDALRTAPDVATADAINQQIWRLWVVPSDPTLAGKMSAVLAMEQAGDLTHAMAQLSQMVIDYPSYAEAWNQRATVEYQLDDYDASLADIDRVLALEPRHYGALSGRVLVYLAEGNRPLALKAMMAALAVDPFLAARSLFPELNQPHTEI